MRWVGNLHPEWGYLTPAPSFMRTVRIVVVATAVGATAGAGVVVALVEHPAAEVGDTSIAAHALVTNVQAASAKPRSAPSSAPTMINPAAIHAVATSVQPGSSEPASAPAMNNPGAAQAQVPAPAPAPAQPAAQESEPSPPPAGEPARSAGTSEAGAASAPQAPARVAAPAEAPSPTGAAPTPAQDEATVAPIAAPAQKKAAKKHHPGGYDMSRAGRPRGEVRERSTNTDRGLGSLLRHLFSARTGPSSYPN